MDSNRPKLTPKEKEVLAFVMRAKTNKEIGKEMGIAPGTVKRHIEHLLRKLNARNRVQLVLYGIHMMSDG